MNPISKKRFSSFALKSSNTAFWQLDLAKQEFFATDVFFEILELPPRDCPIRIFTVLRYISALLSPEQRFSLAEANRFCLERNEPYSLNFFILTKTGAEKWVKLFAEFVQEDDHTYIQGSLQDITQQKQTEEALKFAQWSNEKSRALIFWIAPDGSIVYANEKVCKQLEYTLPELKKLYLFDLSRHFTRKNWKSIWVQTMKHGLPPTEIIFKGKNGTLLPVEIHSEYHRLLGKELLFLFGNDLSFLKNVQLELKKAMASIEDLRLQIDTVEAAKLPASASAHNKQFGIITNDKEFLKVLAKAKEAAPTNTTILLLGETGTGKQLLANAIHQMSRRSDKPFVVVDCATLPRELIESELFGHEQGAFTGAVKSRSGRFEDADGGTIFLDEIGELPLDLQPKLLRVLQESSFERLGSNQTRKVDVRIIAATNQDLAALVKAGKFRRDLFYRLNVLTLVSPPLRERKSDIPLLVRHFLKKFNEKTGKNVHSIPKKVMNKLQAHDYAGNIREIENIMEQAVVLAKNSRLEIDSAFPTQEMSERIDHFKTFEQMQRDHILAALKLTNWRVSGEEGAARMLDMNPKTLETKMRKLGIKRPRLKYW